MSSVNDPLPIGEVDPNLEDRSNRGFDPAITVRPPRDIGQPLAAFPVDVTIRRPPSLNVKQAESNNDHTNTMQTILVPVISTNRTPELALNLSRLLVKRDAELAAIDDPIAQKGVEILNTQLRMFEHLYILKQGLT